MQVNDTNETAVRIIQVADKLFFTYGYSRVSVDEIAAELGMSKKTIYKHFSSKEALLKAAIDAFDEELQAGTATIFALDNIPFNEKMDRFIQFMGSNMGKINSPQMINIRRTAPNVWRHIELLRRRNIQDKFGALLAEGVQQGHIRKDVNVELVQLMILGALEKLIPSEQAINLPLTGVEILQMTTQIILNGILK